MRLVYFGKYATRRSYQNDMSDSQLTVWIETWGYQSYFRRVSGFRGIEALPGV